MHTSLGSGPRGRDGNASRVSAGALLVLLCLLLSPLAGPVVSSSRPPSPAGPTSSAAASPLRSSSGAHLSASPSPRGQPQPSRPSLPSPLSKIPDCNASGLPPPPLEVNVNASQTCTLVSNYTIVAGELSFWLPTDLYVNSSSEPENNLTLYISAGSTLLLGDVLPPTPGVPSDAFLDVENGSSLRLVVMGTLEVVGGAGVWLSSTSSLLLGPTGRIVLYGGQIFTPPGSSVQLKGGDLVLNGGAAWSGTAPPTAGVEGQGVVGHIRLGGSVGSLEDQGTSIENFTVGEVGNLTVAESTVDRLNATSAFSLDFSGFYSRPELVSNLSVQQVGTFRADDAVLENVQMTSAGVVQLGNLTASPDVVAVDGFTVGTAVESLSLAHATVSGLGISTATRVVVENSTFSSGASVTQATTSFSANGTSRFAFPLVFNNAPRVNLTNVTSPEIIVDGTANVTVNNWPYATVLSGTSPTAGSLPTISVAQANVAVHVNRYLIVSVSTPGAIALPPGTRVTVCNAVVTTLCAGGPVNSQGDLGLFVPTDVVSVAGVDEFVGTYQITVTSPAFTTQQMTVQVISDDQRVPIVLSSPVVPPQLVPVFAAELAGMAVVVGGIVYLRTLTRRVRKPRQIVKSPIEGAAGKEEGAAGSTEKPASAEAAPVPRRRRGPAREWKAPTTSSSARSAGKEGSPPKISVAAATSPSAPKAATASASADREPGKEAGGGEQK